MSRVRSEFGRSDITGRFDLAQRHPFAMAEDGLFISGAGTPCEFAACPSVRLAGQRAADGHLGLIPLAVQAQ